MLMGIGRAARHLNHSNEEQPPARLHPARAKKSLHKGRFHGRWAAPAGFRPLSRYSRE